MRLTPFRNRSSDSDGDESTMQAATSLNVLEYDEESSIGHRFPRSAESPDPPASASAENWDVVTVLEERSGPVTVDEITDRLYEPTGADDVDGWADVHEQLVREDLPALDASGVVEFDPQRGTVTLGEEHDRPPIGDAVKRAALVVAAVGLLVPVVVQALPLVLSALSVLTAGAGIVFAAVAY